MTSPLIDDQATRPDVLTDDEARGSAPAHIAELRVQPSVRNGKHDASPHEEAPPNTSSPEEQVSERSAERDMPKDDPARSDAPGRDTYTLSVEQIMQRLDVEGVSKSKRTVQKYLNRGELDGRLVSVANGKKWLANELDLARFIEELKRKEALALYTQPDKEAVSMPVVGERIAEPLTPSPETAVLKERVDQLQARLDSSDSEITYLRGQVQSANDHVKLWSDRATELKDLLQAQTENNQPVLAAFAASLEAQARREERKDTQGRDVPSLL